MSIQRYKGEPLPIIVEFTSNPFTPYGKDYSDIVDVTMNLKRDLANDADDSILEKSVLGGGVSYDESTHKFIMIIDTDDYTNLEIGYTYYLTLNADVGFNNFLELDMKDREVLITQDVNRA